MLSAHVHCFVHTFLDRSAEQQWGFRVTGNCKKIFPTFQTEIRVRKSVVTKTRSVLQWATVFDAILTSWQENLWAVSKFDTNLLRSVHTRRQVAATCRSDKSLRMYRRIFLKIFVSATEFCRSNMLQKIKSDRNCATCRGDKIGKFCIPWRPWGEHFSEANAGHLLCKNKNKHR